MSEVLDFDVWGKVEPEPIYVHTSDRVLYKRCRRMWSFFSSTRQGLMVADAEENINLWLGTALHFALEDYHGYNKFGDPVRALEAFYDCWPEDKRPIAADEGFVTLIHMMEHYRTNWLPQRNNYHTLWIDGVPQVEVPFELLLPPEICPGRPVIYRGTLDRVVVDPMGQLWVEDYKTARSIDIKRPANDPQLRAYVWAAEQHYQRPFAGGLMLQLLKDHPDPVRMLVNGEFSVDKRQKTTYAIFRRQLIDKYGEKLERVPGKYLEFLTSLAESETVEGDRFIRWDEIPMNRAVKLSTYEQIYDEAVEMCNPNLPLYPNQTRDCSWECKIRTICIAMDTGEDWREIVRQTLCAKVDDKQWRQRVRWPEQPQIKLEVPLLEGPVS